MIGFDDKLIAHFGNNQTITRNQLLDFFSSFDPQINEGTFGWKIYDLKRKNILEPLKKGLYQLVSKGRYHPKFSKVLLATTKVLKSVLEVNYNVWETNWLNEFVELQATSSMLVIETSKDSAETTFYTLKDHGFKNVYLKPNEDIMDKYVSELSESVIIKPMISRAPTQEVDGISIATLEKILVDVFCDPKLFFAYQGIQLVKIYEKAFEKYTINLSKLLNYARRRNREDKITEFLLENMDDKIKALIK